MSGNNANDISWFDAKYAAEAMGGYLATITSKAEEDYLQSTSAFAGAVKGEGIRAWIGLSDAEEEGIFKWVTGPEAGPRTCHNASLRCRSSRFSSSWSQA